MDGLESLRCSYRTTAEAVDRFSSWKIKMTVDGGVAPSPEK
jgi:hypothetical protein